MNNPVHVAFIKKFHNLVIDILNKDFTQNLKVRENFVDWNNIESQKDAKMPAAKLPKKVDKKRKQAGKLVMKLLNITCNIIAKLPLLHHQAIKNQNKRLNCLRILKMGFKMLRTIR
jgi:hypothetical protein